MAFHNDELSREISWGSSSSVVSRTSVIELPSGAEQRASNWSAPRMRFVLRLEDLSVEQLTEIRTFHRAREGRTHSFRIWDPADYSTNPLQRPENALTVLPTSADVALSPSAGDGSNHTFQLVKRYSSGGVDRVRRLVKPIPGTVRFALAGVEQVEGVDFTVDYDTGEILVSGSAPSLGVVATGGCQFNVQGRFEQDEIEAIISAFDNGDVPECSVIEVFDDSSTDDEYLRGGSSRPPFTADLQLSPSHGRLVLLDPASSGLVARLPSFTAYARGGVHWKLVNLSATEDFDVTFQGSSIATVAASTTAEVWLGLNSSNTASEWLVLA